MGSQRQDTSVARRLLFASGTLVAVAAAVTVLALAGVFSGEDDDGDRAAPSAGSTEPAPDRAGGEPGGAPGGEPAPRLATVRVGGRPTAVAAGEGAIWVADSFAARGAVLDSEDPAAEPTRLALEGAASDVAADGERGFFALPEQGAVERRELADPGAAGETIRLDGFPSVVAAGEGAVWALSDRTVERIDPGTGEVAGRTAVDGFGSSVAAGEGGIWVVTGNREVTRIDPDSGEAGGEAVEVPQAFGVSTGEGAVWVVSASGEVTRIDPDSLEASAAPAPVRGALDVAAGFGSVWVTSSRRTVTRLDPDTLEPLGEPLEVGDEPASVAIGEDAVWVANGGDGTLTRISPWGQPPYTQPP